MFGLVLQISLFKWKDHKLHNICKEQWKGFEKYKEKVVWASSRIKNIDKNIDRDIDRNIDRDIQVKHLIEIFFSLVSQILFYTLPTLIRLNR